jgi:DNA-binding NarL/FixJ family response regulator
VIAEVDEVTEMMAAFDLGARGFIPSSAGVETIIEAARLCLSVDPSCFTKGVFLPIASLHALRSAILVSPKDQTEFLGHFTDKQLAICEALRRGKSNKTIAYDLSMCESTVKVHVRIIMKKLRASNRTEAAFKLNTVLSRESN